MNIKEVKPSITKLLQKHRPELVEEWNDLIFIHEGRTFLNKYFPRGLDWGQEDVIRSVSILKQMLEDK